MTLDLTPEQGALVRDMARHDAEGLAEVVAGCNADPWEARAFERTTTLAAQLEAGALTVDVPSLADFADMALGALEQSLYAIDGVGDTAGHREPLRRLSGLVGVPARGGLCGVGLRLTN